MDKYMNNLVQEYVRSSNIKHIDLNSTLFIKDFANFIKEREKEGKIYFDFLDYLSTTPMLDNNTCEVNKGKYDSIVKDKDMLIITPFFNDFERCNFKMIIPREFTVIDDMPYIKNEKGIENISHFTITRYITQNPYDKSYIKDFDKLHNNNFGIAVGVYGNIYDKDIEYKINMLEALKDKLIDSYTCEYATSKDCYMYAVVSNKLVRRR